MSVNKQETASEKPASSEKSSKKSNRVYVGNLAWKVHWQDLKDHMRQFGGNVVRADIFEDNQGRSRGCGIVEYETANEAEQAIKNLTDTVLFGKLKKKKTFIKDRRIFVREDREDYGALSLRTRSYYGSRRGGRNTSSKRRYSDENAIEGCQIFVGNLPFKTTFRELKDLFNETGTVTRADVYEQNGKSRGCGTIQFKEKTNAQEAIEKFNNYEYDGRKLIVRLDEMKSSRRSNSKQ